MPSGNGRSLGLGGLEGRRYFTKDHYAYRTHNIHIYQTGHESIERHLSFAAFLRSHEPVCRQYEALKREAYAHHPADIMAYNDAKDAWIRRMEPVAIEWYRQQ